MSTQVLSNCFISINGVDVSGQGTSVAIAMSADAHDITAFGDTTRKHIGGTMDWTMSFEFLADEEVTGEFFDLLQKVVDVEVRPSAEPRSATNPSYVGKGLVTEFTPMDGAVGDAHTVSMTLVSASDLQRLTAEV